MGFWDLIYPKKCLGCGKNGKYFCGDCVKTIDLSDECFNNHLSLFCYRGIVREAVKQLKFRFLSDLEKELVPVVESGLKRKLNQPNTALFREFLRSQPLIQPLPLFWYRRNWRGFNQAEMLARIIARVLGLELADCLSRVRLGTPQSRLKRRDRLVNVAGIFRVKPGKIPREILLIDDVWTTGATMGEAVTVLSRAGAGKIWGLTLAR